jgi:hypothetical protein
MSDPNYFPVSQYAPVKYDRDDPTSPANNDLLVLSGEPNSISDRCSEPMAILYYPARLGVTGLNQFDEGDNSAYVTGAADGGWQNAESTGFSNYIKNRRFEGTASATPYGKGSFIMITAGIDRQYGTLDDGHYPHW